VAKTYYLAIFQAKTKWKDGYIQKVSERGEILAACVHQTEGATASSAATWTN
jgi:hypothetical protein